MDTKVTLPDALRTALASFLDTLEPPDGLEQPRLMLTFQGASRGYVVAVFPCPPWKSEELTPSAVPRSIEVVDLADLSCNREANSAGKK